MRKAIIICFAFFSCTATKPKEASQTLDFGTFSFVAPASWKAIKMQGIDSQIGRIALDDKDTLFFDLGFFSNNLEEYEPTGNAGNDFNKDRKTKNTWESIAGYNTKVVTPQKPGSGLTGIYIDSLWTDGSVVKFNLQGRNLSKHNQDVFLQSIKSLQFKQPR